MAITASTLWGNIYRLLDQVFETGQPLEIERKGKLLKIIPEERTDKMSRLVKHACIKGDPESIVHMDWSDEWQDDLPEKSERNTKRHAGIRIDPIADYKHKT